MSEKRRKMLCVLGRGIQQAYENGPWTPTGDLELCDERSDHLPVQQPVDDKNPLCMVGGGELNIRAGVVLYIQQLLKESPYDLAALEYGNRSEYLLKVNGPRGSEVCAKEFIQRIESETGGAPNVDIFDEAAWNVKGSNTNQELHNMFTCAIKNGIEEVHLVTIDLHMPRTFVLAQRHLANPELAHLNLRFFTSEQVLAGADPAQFDLRREALRQSKSFARNWEREQVRIFKILTNAYGDEKPLVAVPTK